MKLLYAIFALMIVTLPIYAEFDCTNIPHSSEALCYKTEDSEFPPMVNWVLYHQDADKQLHELDNDRYTLTIPGGFIFSPSGKYLLQEFAEEGHPMYALYLTEAFVHDNKVNSLGWFSEYEMDELISLSDEGIVHYRLMENGCETTEQGCERKLDLLTTPRD